MPDEVHVKVKAYPFAVQLKTKDGDLKGQVIKLTTQGFLAELQGTKLQPGDLLEVNFELPVLHKVVTSAGRTIKFYSQWSGLSQTPDGKPSGRIGHLVEIHFVELNDANLESITSFLRALPKSKQSPD